MEVTVPIKIEAKEVANEIVSQALKAFDTRMNLMADTYDLPPYPTQEQLKQALGIGQSRLNDWIAMGLKKQIWSTGSIRFDREEVRKFLKENFEVQEESQCGAYTEYSHVWHLHAAQIFIDGIRNERG